MTKPGRHPWAEDDVWTAGLDVGADTKAAPPQANVDEGYYRRRRPGPDVFNWQLHRNALIHEALARMQGMNFQHILTGTTNYTAPRALMSSCHYGDTNNRNIACSLFHWHNGGNTVEELSAPHGVVWTSTGPVEVGIVSLPLALDSDGSEGDHRIVVIHTTTKDNVRYNTGGVWADTSIQGATPNYDWTSVGCDRDTAGGATAHWLVGAYTAAGTSAEIWSSTNGIAFAQEAGFTTANGRTVDGIHHSCHPAGALGPDDLGNPVWLAVTDANDVYRSVDHVTWLGPVALGHKAGTARSTAYSRPSRRWVVAHSENRFGDISYSDDNGATWTYVAGALPIETGHITASIDAHITGDGYGTFLVTRHDRDGGISDGKMWISIDEGLTWSVFEIPDAAMAVWGVNVSYVIEGCYQSDNDVDGTPPSEGFFIFAGYDNTTVETRIFRSLIV